MNSKFKKFSDDEVYIMLRTFIAGAGEIWSSNLFSEDEMNTFNRLLNELVCEDCERNDS